MAVYAELRAKQSKDLFDLLPRMIDHLSWSDAELRVERERRLRQLVRVALDRSPWHRRRLSSLEVAMLSEDNVAELPTMTKDDLLSNFDEIVTDPRLSRDIVEAHLTDLHDDAYLLDRYHRGDPAPRGRSQWTRASAP